jgi:hypothetical protein
MSYWNYYRMRRRVVSCDMRNANLNRLELKEILNTHLLYSFH